MQFPMLDLLSQKPVLSSQTLCSTSSPEFEKPLDFPYDERIPGRFCLHFSHGDIP